MLTFVLKSTTCLQSRHVCNYNPLEVGQKITHRAGFFLLILTNIATIDSTDISNVVMAIHLSTRDHAVSPHFFFRLNTFHRHNIIFPYCKQDTLKVLYSFNSPAATGLNVVLVYIYM